MKVLNLKLKNLNSLRGEFHLDFTREPFVDAGLFAVIGPTGAGKSTIFDALCIALYGETPRLQKRKAAGSGVLEIVSRHTAEAWAEVEFEVPQGCYRSRWEVHRARGSVTGAFQQPRMRLAKIDSAGEELIEDKLSEVPDRIALLTGLDFTRFTRSVLLAQGAFAAFLDAKPNERADLLEKMTGSFIYSELSRLAFERAREEEQKGVEIARRIQDVRVLDEESLDLVHEQLKAAVERYDRARESRDAMVLAVEKARRGRKLSAELDEIADGMEKLEEQRESVDTMREQLKLHRLVEPHWNDIRRFDLLKDELSGAAADIREINSSLELLTTEILDLESGMGDLRESLKISRAQLSGIREKKGEAEKLEALLSERKARLADEEERVQHLQKQLSRNLEIIEELEDRLSGLKLDKQKLEAAADNSGLYELSLNRELFFTRLSEWKSFNEDIQELNDEIELLRREQGTLTGITEAASLPELSALRKELSELEQDLADTGSSGALRSELSELDLRLGELKALVPWAERRESLREELLQVHRHLENLEKEIETARQDSETARVHRDQGEEWHLHQAAQSLKEGLKKGSPCPVCGSREHPGVRQKELFSGEAPEEAIDFSAAEERYRDTLIRLATLRGSRDSQREKASALDAEIRGLSTRLADQDCSSAILEDLDRRRADLSERHARSLGIEKKRDELRLRLDQLLEQEEAAREEQARTGNRAAVVEERIRGHLESLRRKEDGLEETAAWILQIARKAGLSGDMEDLRELAVKSLDDYRQSCGKLEEIVSEERSSSEKLEQYSLDLAERRQELDKLSARRDELQKQVSEISGSLMELTGGQSVQDLLQLKEQKVRDLEDDLEALQNRVNSGKEKRAVFQGRLETAESLFEGKRQERETLQRDLSRRALAAGFSDTDDFRSSYLEDAQARREAVEEWAASSMSLEQRREELTRELQEIPGELRDSTRVEKELADADEEYAAAQKELFGCQSRIAADRENREHRERLLKEQEDQRKEYQIWWRLKGLIGSASGDAFRRFAQGLTLDYLVSLANRHLDRFSGRYRLQRDGGEELSLFIVDTWQADAVRPVETLSGGETFLASLSLALGLSELAGRKTRIDSLFLDEGFGTLDSETLETVLAALETLRSSGKLVGIISHVDTLKERVPVQIRVRRRGTGYSTLAVYPETVG